MFFDRHNGKAINFQCNESSPDNLSIPTSTHSKESDTPILLDEAEQTRRLEERQKLFKEYRISRQAVLEMRDEDRQRRNQAKVKQIELAEQWQVRTKGYMHGRRYMGDGR